MEQSTSSCGVIGEKTLKIWKIFRSVGEEGEEILKTAKLAHVANDKVGFVVSTTDETYSFFREEDDDEISEDDEVSEDEGAGPRVSKIGKIPELSGIRVKEFFTGEVNFALTEDGRLFSWWREPDPDDSFEGCEQNVVNQLGRHVFHRAADKIALFRRPAPVTAGSLRGVKVRQVAFSEFIATYTVAVSSDGDVHQWGSVRTWDRPMAHCWKPRLIPREHFDYQDVISVACSDYVGVALTSNGDLFQWELSDKVPQKVEFTGSVPFKKITGSCDFIFALNVKGEMRYLEKDEEEENLHKWMTIFEDHKIADIASFSGASGVVVELKNDTRFAFSFCKKEYPALSHIPLFTLPSCASMDELFAKHGDKSYRTISAQIEPPPRRCVSDGISNLWENKKHADVAFSVEGKVITAHKCILAERSEYFERMFSQGWNEAKGGSAIDVKDTKHAIFEALLFYIYTDEIKFEEDEYENIFDLMKLADSYCDVNIRHKCEKILISNINAENALFFASNASSANASTLAEKVINFIADNQLLVDDSSPEEMIDFVGMEEAFQKISALLHQ